MTTKNIPPHILPFCVSCKTLAETGRVSSERMRYVEDSIHFFTYNNAMYSFRFEECITCRRTYLHVRVYGGYIPVSGTYYPFPCEYPMIETEAK